jgi:hypothetical protein
MSAKDLIEQVVQGRDPRKLVESSEKVKHFALRSVAAVEKKLGKNPTAAELQKFLRFIAPCAPLFGEREVEDWYFVVKKELKDRGYNVDV